ncbi:hypothetical protein SAMN04487968_105131 [Nocardioides terrae]|uniref:Uncharacterized protein n=2 Tax=Nocardioides terrae TaxID=574651 RepID=A0A1I1IAH6_9ACTN|nr:hypothetical protein SAMN04487968_105131 [Nocardioides terrae]
MDPCLLWARAAIVGSLAFGLGVVGHVTAGGLLPGGTALAVMAVAAVVLSGPMLAKPASTVRLLAMTLGGQTVVHAVLTVTAGHVGDPVRPGTHASVPPPTADPYATLPVVNGHRVGSLQDAFQVGTSPSSAEPALPVLPIGHLLHDMSAHAPMMVVHLVAGVLVTLWLARGEHCLWTLLALTGRRITLVALLHLTVVLPRTSLRGYLRTQAPAGPVSVWLSRPDTRRGPPLLAA